MSTDSLPIFDAALALPQALRADLAAKLLESLDDSADFGIDAPNFEDELARRSRELREGTAKAYTIDETIAAMRDAVAKRSQT